MRAIKVNETTDGQAMFCVTDDGKQYEVIGSDVRIVRYVNGGSQRVRMSHPRYADLRARVLAACAA